MADFDIISYLSGLTTFVFDKEVLKRIALERGVSEVTCFSELTQQQKDLCLADELYTAYVGSDVMASDTLSHGSFSHTVGPQTINTKNRLYDVMVSIYTKYEELDKLASLPNNDGDLSWIDENTDLECL